MFGFWWWKKWFIFYVIHPKSILTSDAWALYPELFNVNLWKYPAPSLHLTIDETFYPLHHQVVFRQYSLNKSQKCGLLCKSLNGATFPYTYNAVPYVCLPKNGNGLYYNIDTTENHVRYLVNATDSDVTLKVRNISTDTLCTSISLGNWHLELNVTTVGTLNSNNCGVPDELKHL